MVITWRNQAGAPVFDKRRIYSPPIRSCMLRHVTVGARLACGLSSAGLEALNAS
jgi:hypothetical protein